jgi:hypothetical protein
MQTLNIQKKIGLITTGGIVPAKISTCGGRNSASLEHYKILKAVALAGL